MEVAMLKRVSLSLVVMFATLMLTVAPLFAAPPSGTSPLTSVAHDGTLTGAGTTSSPLSVVSPYTGVVHDSSLIGAGTAASPLKVAPSVGVAPSMGAQVGPFISMTTTADTFVPVPFTVANAEYDTSGFIGTNAFIVPAAGIYVVTIHANADNSGGVVDDRISLAYRINGGGLIGLLNHAVRAGQDVHANASFQKMLQAGDQVEILVYTSNNFVVDQIEMGIGKL